MTAGPLDLVMVAALRKVVGDTNLRRLIDQFVANAGDGFDRMDGSARAGDDTSVSSEAHRLRGSALALGMVQLGSLLEAVEHGKAWSQVRLEARELAEDSCLALRKLFDD